MKNNRTFLEKLLDGAKVEWKPLKKVCNFISTGKLNANAMDENGIYPFFTCNEKPYKINNYAFDMEAILISGNGSQVGHLNYFKGKFNAYQRTYVIGEFDNNTLAMYLYHYLNFKLRDYITINSKKGSVPYITLPMLEKFEIPIPPLPVQTEIVKILDALTALTSELTSELTLRRKQYEYYREKLLSEEELGKVGFKWKTLEELVEKTQNIRWKNNTKTYRYIDLTSVDRENNSITGTIEINALNAPSRAQKIVKENDIIFATTRPTQQRVALISKEFSDEIASTGYCVLRANTKIVLPKWLFYFLSTVNFKNYVEENQSGSAYPAISDSKVKEFRIPVPEITIQQSIIEKLDKFYSLTNSLLHGLPKEINNRTKQYLYYQKELLNFLRDNIYE